MAERLAGIPPHHETESTPQKRIEIKFIAQKNSGHVHPSFKESLQAALRQREQSGGKTKILLATWDKQEVADAYREFSNSSEAYEKPKDNKTINQFRYEMATLLHNTHLDDIFSITIPPTHPEIADANEIQETEKQILRNAYKGFSSDEDVSRASQKMEQISQARARYTRTFEKVAQQKLSETIANIIKTPTVDNAIILVDLGLDYTNLIFEAHQQLTERVAETAGLSHKDLEKRGTIYISHTIADLPLVYPPHIVAQRQLIYADRLAGRHSEYSEQEIDWERVLFAKIFTDAFGTINPEDKIDSAQRNKSFQLIARRLPKNAIHAFFRDTTDIYPSEYPDQITERLYELEAMRKTRDRILKQMEELIPIPPQVEQLIASGQLDPETMTVNDAQALRKHFGTTRPLGPKQKQEVERLKLELERSGALDYDDNIANLEAQEAIRKLELIGQRSNERRTSIRNMIEAELSMLTIFISAAKGEEKAAKEEEYNRLLTAYQTIDIEDIATQNGAYYYNAKPSRRLTFYERKDK